jgi:hypothetical protein
VRPASPMSSPGDAARIRRSAQSAVRNGTPGRQRVSAKARANERDVSGRRERSGTRPAFGCRARVGYAIDLGQFRSSLRCSAIIRASDFRYARNRVLLRSSVFELCNRQP